MIIWKLSNDLLIWKKGSVNYSVTLGDQLVKYHKKRILAKIACSLVIYLRDWTEMHCSYNMAQLFAKSLFTNAAKYFPVKNPLEKSAPK